MEKNGKGGKKRRNIKGKRDKMKRLSWLVLHTIHQKKESPTTDLSLITSFSEDCTASLQCTLPTRQYIYRVAGSCVLTTQYANSRENYTMNTSVF